MIKMHLWPYVNKGFVTGQQTYKLKWPINITHLLYQLPPIFNLKFTLHTEGHLQSGTVYTLLQVSMTESQN